MSYNFIEFFFEILKACKSDDSIFKLNCSDIIYLCHDVDRPLLKDGLFFSPIMDTFSSLFASNIVRSVCISLPFSVMTKSQTWGSYLKFNRYFYISFACDRIISFFFRSKKVFFQKLLYRYIFKKVKPKCVVVIGANPAMCVAGRFSNVKVVELLHGMGITPIPWGWDRRVREELPNCVLCFDDVSCSTFKLLNDIVVFRAKHPFIEYFLRSRAFNALPPEWRSRKDSGQFEKEILVTLSWGYAGDSGENSCFDSILHNGVFYDDIIKVVLSTNNSILWRFRLHPVHLRSDKYAWVIRLVDGLASQYSNIEWVESSNLPLLSVLSTCSGHISMLSTSAYEAACLGVTSLLLCPTLRDGGKYSDMFSDLVRYGYVIKSHSSFDVILQWAKDVKLVLPLIDYAEDNCSMKDAIEWMLSDS